MSRYRTILASLAIGVIATAGAASGAQASVTTVETSPEKVIQMVVDAIDTAPTPCQPDTGNCCAHNPQDPKNVCGTDPCSVDVCEPPTAVESTRE